MADSIENLEVEAIDPMAPQWRFEPKLISLFMQNVQTGGQTADVRWVEAHNFDNGAIDLTRFNGYEFSKSGNVDVDLATIMLSRNADGSINEPLVNAMLSSFGLRLKVQPVTPE